MAASLWRHRRHDRKACLPAPFKSCHVRATVRNADVDEGNRKTADFTCFFFLRENRRSASKGFFLAWLNSGKKQTRLTTRLVVFSAFSAWRHNNGFVKSLVRKIYRLPLYFPLFLKFPVCLCVYIYIWRKGACIFALHKLKVGFTQVVY